MIKTLLLINKNLQVSITDFVQAKYFKLKFNAIIDENLGSSLLGGVCAFARSCLRHFFTVRKQTSGIRKN